MDPRPTPADAARPPSGRPLLALAALSLLGQVSLGLHLRAALGGQVAPWGAFDDLRRAHSHLGYYGLLFPMAWWAWAQAGLPTPRPRGLAVYALATALGTVGFALQGYAALSIAASTVVLGVWLSSAWGLRAQLKGSVGRRHASWWAPAIPAILLSAITIPAVAATLRRDPALSHELVQGFMTLLLYGVAVPAALARQGAPAPDSRLWTLGAVGAALLLGPLPGLPSGLLTLLCAALLARAAWACKGPWDLRLLWLLPVLGLIGLGTGLLAESRGLAIAGFHLVVLGPVLLSLGGDLLPIHRPLYRGAWHLGLGALTLGVLVPLWSVDLVWTRVAVAGGALLALLAFVGIATRGSRTLISA